jgi:hypothetical protein
MNEWDQTAPVRESHSFIRSGTCEHKYLGSIGRVCLPKRVHEPEVVRASTRMSDRKTEG